jgi:hypothetical protein
MVKRRVRSRPQGAIGEQENFSQTDVLENLGDLQNIAALLQDEQGLNPEQELSGTAQPLEEEQTLDVPRTPANPDLYGDYGQPMPEGVELLANLDQGDGQEESRGVLGSIYDYFSPTKRQEMSEQNAQLFEKPRQDAGYYQGYDPQADVEPEPKKGILRSIWDAGKVSEEDKKRLFEDNARRDQAREQGLTLEDFDQQQSAMQQQYNDSIREAIQNPYSKSVYGATDTVLNSPELSAQVEKIGVEMTPEIEEMTKQMELAISDMSDQEIVAQGEWDDQIADIRSRIESNQATDKDKFFIGLALIMPLIVGGLFGAEAGLGALAGGAGGLSEQFSEREKGIREDEKSLSDLTKLKGESKLKQQKLEIEKAKIPGEVKKLIGEGPLAHLKGMNLVTYTDAEGNKVEGVEMKPGLVAKLEFLDDKEAKKDMRSQAEEINQTRSGVNKLADNARRIVEISQQIDDPGFFTNVFQGWAKGKKPSIVAKFGKDIMVDGRKVNSAVVLTQVLEDTLEARRNVQKIKNFGPQLFEHFERILTNPYGQFTTPQDLIDQTMRLYTDTRDQFLDDVERRGFLKDPVLGDFREKDSKMFDSLNRQEDYSDASRLKKSLKTEEANG